MHFFKKDLNSKVQIDIDKNNLIRIHNMSIIIIVLELLMLVMGSFLNLPQYYIYSYYLLLFFVLLFYFFTSRKFNKFIMFEKILMAIAIYGFSFWGIAIALFDINRDIAPFVYLINISYISFLYIFTPIGAFIFNFINMILFYSLLFVFDYLSVAILVNFSFFHLVLFLISIDKYKSYIQNYKDSSSLKIVNDELKVLSTIDQLSGCKNRRGLNYELVKYENKFIFALLADIDNFKEINDSFGHDIGDLFIVNFAKILQSNFGIDKVFRIGGDEFFIISDCETLQNSLKKFEISRREIREIKFVKNVDITMSVSAGYTYKKLINREYFEKIYKELDMAMYEAKARGKDCVYKSDDIFKE